jgi:CspA family cold shock protein
MKGTVELFDENKGIGFIKPDEGDTDLFVNRGNIKTENHTLREGQRVEFEIILGERGEEAINVKEI